MLRAPLSLEKMSYDPEPCTVIYRSQMHKTLKRNFQVMYGADWMAQLCLSHPRRDGAIARYRCFDPGSACFTTLSGTVSPCRSVKTVFRLNPRSSSTTT